MGDRYVKLDKNKEEIVYRGSKNLHGGATSESLPYDKNIFDKNVNSEDILITSDDADIGYFIECDIKYPDNIKEKQTNSPFALRIKLVLKIILVII